jgi:hypothetical protein
MPSDTETDLVSALHFRRVMRIVGVDLERKDE